MSWTRESLSESLRNNRMNLQFIKADGSLREMRATLVASDIPTGAGQGKKATNEQVLPVWDLDKASWRSVRIDRLLHAEVESL